jgi:hypothetical protein
VRSVITCKLREVLFDLIKVIRWAGQVARMGKVRNSYENLVGKPEEKRPLGRPRRT